MNLINTTDYRRVSFPGALIVAPAALALIVALLWFASIRTGTTVSAHHVDPGSDSYPVQSMTESGEDGINSCILPVYCWGNPESPLGEPQTAEQGNQNFGSASITGTSFVAGGDQIDGRCTFIGNPCYQDPGIGYIDQSASLQVNQELRTY